MTEANFSQPAENGQTLETQHPQPPISQEPKDTPVPPFANSGIPSGKKKPKILLLTLAITLLVAGLTSAGYRLGLHRQLGLKELPLATTPTPTVPSLPTFAPSPILTIPPTLIPSPTPDPTAGWKTHKNENCKYEISYPVNWFLTETAGGDDCQGGGDILTSYEPPKVQVKDPDFFKGKLKIDMGRLIQTKPTNQSLEEWLKGYEKSLGIAEETATLISQETISLAGKKAIRQIKAFMNEKGLNYYIENGIYVYFISAGGDFSIHQETFDQILSTFKFLN